MNYEEFKAEVMEELRIYYGAGTELCLTKINRVFDKSYDGILVRKLGVTEQMSPVINLEEYYEKYRNRDEGVRYWCNEMIRMLDESSRDESVLKFCKAVRSWGTVRKRVLPHFMPMNYQPEKGSDMIVGRFRDLMYCYAVLDSFSDKGVCTIRITKSLLKSYGITEEELHEQAMKNLNDMGYEFYKMGMAKGGNGVSLNQCKTELEPGMFYVLQSAMQVGGAAVLLNEELIRSLFGDTDCYLVPSSIHELLVLKDVGAMSYQEINQIIQDVNKTDVDEYDRLADHCFYYNGSTGEIISLYDEECREVV